ncbi:MAG: histidine--tRNA ligase [Spirochaetales bacterium]|nr:histidine--tRNA ligase [Spirochaetales bacterium]
MGDIIQARVLKGFRDMLPVAEIQRASLIDRLSATFRSFGFVPIDTPVLEYAEILLGKAGGETEKQVYRFTDSGGRDVAMRFDLTVPFARFMAEHLSELYLPFKRYHMAKVWRGENTQRGRYREFMQCDFDIVGVDSAAADFEIVAVMRAAMVALGAPDSRVHLNNRAVFNRFLERLGAANASTDILRVVDKLHKIGQDDTRAQLAAIAGQSAADELLAFIASGDDYDATLERVTRLAGGPGPDTDRLAEIRDMAVASGIADAVVLAPSITRGLDYYTGVVFETFLDALPDIGSVCSGGRYNDLASLYTHQKLPGVGASVGIDRLLAAFEALGRSGTSGVAPSVLVFNLVDGKNAVYQAAAAAFRAAGLTAEVYPERKKLGQQFAYAEKKGAAFGLIRGSAEEERGVWVLKDLAARAQTEYPSLEDAVKAASARA